MTCWDNVSCFGAVCALSSAPISLGGGVGCIVVEVKDKTRRLTSEPNVTGHTGRHESHATLMKWKSKIRSPDSCRWLLVVASLQYDDQPQIQYQPGYKPTSTYHGPFYTLSISAFTMPDNSAPDSPPRLPRRGRKKDHPRMIGPWKIGRTIGKGAMGMYAYLHLYAINADSFQVS